MTPRSLAAALLLGVLLAGRLTSSGKVLSGEDMVAMGMPELAGLADGDRSPASLAALEQHGVSGMGDLLGKDKKTPAAAADGDGKPPQGMGAAPTGDMELVPQGDGTSALSMNALTEEVHIARRACHVARQWRALPCRSKHINAANAIVRLLHVRGVGPAPCPPARTRDGMHFERTGLLVSLVPRPSRSGVSHRRLVFVGKGRFSDPRVDALRQLPRHRLPALPWPAALRGQGKQKTRDPPPTRGLLPGFPMANIPPGVPSARPAPGSSLAHGLPTSCP